MNQKAALAMGLFILFLGGVAAYVITAGKPETPPAAPAPADMAQIQRDPPRTAEVPRVEFSLPDIDGQPRNSSEWEGKARLINFWATWCAPCRREIPLLKKTQEAHAADNLQVIGIAVDFPAEVSAYAEEAQFNYPVLVGQEDAMAIAETSGIDFIGMPFTMVVAPGGELLKAHLGEIHESHIETIVAVFADLAAGRVDTAGARKALGQL
ncbi:MAG: TlpA family protein disulfide reductase [Gammaproteobacteria bacterium]|nr:TlpA family protein disulfide reductase [Gammaproteobacteria bacterium]